MLYTIQSFNEVASLNGVSLKDTDKEARSLHQELSQYKGEHSSLIEKIKDFVRKDCHEQITQELRLVKAVYLISNGERVH